MFAVVLPVVAEAYPTKPIRFIVPFPPGGGADFVARTVAERLSRAVSQQVIIDNRPGGGTVIGAQLAAHAVPDGYTLFLGTPTTHAINVSLVKNLPYDPSKDFAPVTLVAILHNVLVMHPYVPAQSLRELIALARKRPGAGRNGALCASREIIGSKSGLIAVSSCARWLDCSAAGVSRLCSNVQEDARRFV
jgi:tripartite-type tricarboxylate transporter receptor subunit TctC